MLISSLFGNVFIDWHLCHADGVIISQNYAYFHMFFLEILLNFFVFSSFIYFFC